jgi:hypothetical protein
MRPEQIAQIPKEVLDLLVDFAIFVSGTWEAGNIDDEEEASMALDEFLAQYGEPTPLQRKLDTTE